MVGQQGARRNRAINYLVLGNQC